MYSEGFSRAVKLLHDALTPEGFVASLTPADNYRRLWTRDAVVAGLAAMMLDDEALLDGLRRSLDTIAAHQGMHGEIPSNVSGDHVSYGTLVGRVDAPLWYVIGVCAYVSRTADRAYGEKHKATMERALFLAACWEFNGGGLIYAPVSGDWADEYVTHGYTLLVQILHYQALAAFGRLFDDGDALAKARRVRELVESNFGTQGEGPSDRLHPSAWQTLRGSPRPYWPAAFRPTGYDTRFDGLANALALLSGIGSSRDADALVDYVESLGAECRSRLLCAFHPPIQPGDGQWEALLNNCRYQFKNHPWSFHNGGLWPMITGFWAAGLVRWNRTRLAAAYAEDIDRANQRGGQGAEWGFHEWHHARTGEPGGVRCATWSAAAAVIAWKSVETGVLPFQATL